MFIFINKYIEHIFKITFEKDEVYKLKGNNIVPDQL